MYNDRGQWAVQLTVLQVTTALNNPFMEINDQVNAKCGSACSYQIDESEYDSNKPIVKRLSASNELSKD